MEAHGLVAQRIKAHGGKVVGRRDLQLVHGVILQLAGCLPEHVDGDKRRDVGAVDRKHLVGFHASGAHAIDDQAHHVRVAVGQEGHEQERRRHKGGEQAEVLAGDLPVIVQGAAGGSRSVRYHEAPSGAYQSWFAKSSSGVSGPLDRMVMVRVARLIVVYRRFCATWSFAGNKPAPASGMIT